VSDGSEWFTTQGSFGWILSSDTGERLATCMGPARGSRPNSYRSEGYGMLALLSFLKRLQEFTYLHEPLHGIIATDSKSLVDTIRGPHRVQIGPSPANVYHRPLDPLSPEWDVIFGIQSLLREMPGLNLQHIKGHQDREHDFHRLPLLAQLNIEADALANRYQRDHGLFQPEVLLTQWAGAHLVLPSGTITSHYESALRYQATAEPLQKYLRERHHWNQTTFDSINWTAHGKSIRYHMHKRTHLIKLVHGILPTNSNLHRNDPIRSLCPCCRKQPEDWKHILQCDSPTRNEWRQSMVKALDNKCVALNTHPELRTTLITGINQWMQWMDRSNDSDFKMNTTKSTSPIIARLILQQNDIGWKQVFLGRFCHIWSDVQEAHYVTTINADKRKKRTGLQWQKAIIGELWSQWFILWELRNKDQHGSTESTRARTEREEVERTLRDIYDLREQMEPSVQQLLCRDVTDHFVKPLWFNKNWLAVHGTLVKKSVRRAKKKAIQGVRSIRQYFTTR
jgi:hypothetical protein